MFSVALLLLAAGFYGKCEHLTQPASVTVQPGQRLTITCQVSYSPGSYYTAWIRQPAGKGLEWIGMKHGGGSSYYKDSLKNTFSIDVDSSSKTVTLNGQNMQPGDSAVYYCAKRGGGNWAFDYWGKGTMVTVTSAAQSAPTVFPLAPCGSGGSDMVTLGCLASGFTPSSITFSWKEGSNSLENIIQYPSMQKGNEYIGIAQVQVSRQDWDARKSFKCVANHAAGERFAIITKPNELFEPPTLKVCSSVEEGKDEAYFSCFAKDFSPNTYQIKWLKDDEEITGKIDEVATLSHGRKDENGTLYSVASLLTLPLNDVTEESKIKCLFTGKGDRNTVVQRNATASLKQCTAVSEGCVEADVDISIIPPSNQDLLTKGKGTLICQVAVKKGTPERIAWEDEKKRELVSERLTGSSRTNKVEIEITYSEWINGAKRVCVYENKDWFDSVKREYKRNNGGVPKRPAVFMLPPVEQTREDTVVLTCYVKDFYPQEIYVAWLVDDDEVGTKYPSSTTEPVKNNGLFSVYSQMILPKDTWEQMDMVFSCAVYHESLANATRSIVRSIGFRTFDKTNVVNLSMNVPETCKA